METRAIEVLIIEDEPRAADRLERMIMTIDPDVIVLDKIPSVEKACLFLTQSAPPDLIFLDIRLEDADCFDIFDQVSVTSPIIFCTAYNEYALPAFKVNSIDYLLKPISAEALSQSLVKYRHLLGYQMSHNGAKKLLADSHSHEKASVYRKRFLTTSRKTFVPIQVQDVNVIMAFMKGSKLMTHQQKEWLLDDSLLDIENSLDPNDFIRISRQSILRIDAIQVVDLHALEVTINTASSPVILAVSRSRVTAVKKALSQ